VSHGAVPLTERMARVPFSRIRKVFERPKVLERDGRPVIFLETGRPGFDTLAHIKDAAKRALDAGEVPYTANHGTPALRAAIAGKLRGDNGLSYDPETEILVTVGAAEAIFAAFLALAGPGDEILYPAPGWLNYAAAASPFIQAMNRVHSCLQPGRAFWLWLNIRRRRATSQDFAPTLLETAFVSLVPGPVFGESGQGHVRLSYANSYERLTDAAKRILRFCT